MFQTKVVEKIKTHILCSTTFSCKSCGLRDNVEKHDGAREATDDNITWRMRFACCITKAIYKHYEYVILIAAPRQQWFRERASVLRYTYIVCLVYIIFYIVNSTSVTLFTHSYTECPFYRVPEDGTLF
jgi:hypothetical protein